MSKDAPHPAEPATYTYDTFAGTRLKWIFVLPFAYAAAMIGRAVVQVDDWTTPFARNVLVANVLAPLVIAVVAWLVGFYYIGRRVTADQGGLTFKPDPNSLWFWTTVAVPWSGVKELHLTSRRAYDVFGAPGFRLEAAVTAAVGDKDQALSLPANLDLLDTIVGRAGLLPTLAGQPALPSELRLGIGPVIGAKRIGWRWERARLQ